MAGPILALVHVLAAVVVGDVAGRAGTLSAGAGLSCGAVGSRAAAGAARAVHTHLAGETVVVLVANGGAHEASATLALCAVGATTAALAAGAVTAAHATRAFPVVLAGGRGAHATLLRCRVRREALRTGALRAVLLDGAERIGTARAVSIARICNRPVDRNEA